MRLLYIIPCLLLYCNLHAQDYRTYHTEIIKAEKQIFVDGYISEGLGTYVSTFGKYDFVFVSDCMTAVQIALYDSNAAALISITDKAMMNGMQPRHLNMIPYIKKHPLYKKYEDSIIAIYHRNRPYYLAGIDTAVLQKMYSLKAFDQMEKNHMKRESHATFRGRYRPQIKKTMDELKTLILSKGWPSDKLIGIAQRDIMKELHTGTPDMGEFYDKYKDVYIHHNFSRGQFYISEYELASTFFFPVMAHYASTVSNIYFPDTVYLQQIAAGFLHPKDMAFVLEFKYRNYPEGGLKPDVSAGQYYFGVSRRGMSDSSAMHRPFPLPYEQMNQLRKKFYMPPFEQDRAKFRFAKEHGMYINWGYFGSRS